MNAIRLLSEFHAGSLTLADAWRRMLDPANADAVLALATEAGTLADAASRRLGLGGEGATARPDHAGDGRGAGRASTSPMTCGRG